MLRTYANRYGLIALIISVTFFALQVIFELAEFGRPLSDLAASLDVLVTLAMAPVFTVAGWWLGHQRDRMTAQTCYITALNRMTLGSLHALDPERALNEALLPITTALSGEDGVLLVTSPDRLTVRAGTSQLPETTLAALRAALAQQAPDVSNTVLTFSVEDWHAVAKEPLPGGIRRLMAVSLPISAEEPNWLVITTRHSGALTADQRSFLQSAAGQLAALLVRTQQMVELRRRARDMEAIAQVNRSLLAGMELDELLQTVVNATQVRFGLPFVGVSWVDEARQEFFLRAAAGPVAQLISPEYRFKLSAGDSSIVYRTGQPYLARNVKQDPYFTFEIDVPIASSFLVPMKVGQKVIGIMEFDSLGVDAFSTDDVAALTTLTDLVTIAVENVRLVSEAQHARRRVGAILRSIVDAIILIDAAGLVQLINPAAEQLVGRTSAEVIGRPIDQAIAQRRLLEVCRRAVNRPVADPVQAVEATLDNGVTYLITIAVVRDEADVFWGWVVALKDITPLKQLDLYKSQMIQMASHDLRAPLSVAMGYLELLGDDLQPLTPQRGRILSKLEATLEHMQQLIADLLDVERVESGVDRMAVPTNVAELVETVVQDLRDAALGKQQTLELQAEPVPPVLGDPAHLKQVFANLVDNAIKYTPEGGQVRVSIKEEDHQVLVEVQDTGCGVPPAAQAKLFQRFFRAKTAGTEHIAGTGLGLSLVKAVVEQHGGRVTVESIEQQGSTFRVWLPTAMTNDQ